VAALRAALYTAGVRASCASAGLALGIALLAGYAHAQDPVTALSLTRAKPVGAAKEFQVATPDNTQLKLADFKGKVVFLNFWATWCKPCEEEMPSMERLYQRFKDKGLVVLAISEDSAGAGVVGAYVKKHNLSFPVGLDPKMSVAGLYGVWAIPSTVIIDKKGQRALVANGPRPWDGPDSQALFQSLLQ
jgi:cytochrome c biogenesis protein CcmG, thiol:disulfide interchange protein DsbE